MTFSNIPNELAYETEAGKVRFTFNGLSTAWMGLDDPFIKRIDEDNLNSEFLGQHITKEIEIKNLLDEAFSHLASEKYQKAIDDFDEVLYYDPDYAEALMGKSHALYGQKHFVKSLRHYKKAIKADESLEDRDYYRLLLEKSHEERDTFPKLKLNIYAGDEFFAKGEFEKAVESYDRALANPSRFKDKILSKLMNKKASALVQLERYGDALECFEKSRNDFSYFGQGYCEYKLELPVNDRFRGYLKIDKKFQLQQAIILNELGFRDESKEICDYLSENHFKCDELYFTLKELEDFFN